MKKLRWVSSVILACLCCICLALGISTANVKTQTVNAAGTWSGGDYSTEQEGNETVYTASVLYVADTPNVLSYSEKVGSYNTFTFKFRPNATYSGDDTANVGFNITDKNGLQISFVFLNYWNCYRVFVAGTKVAEGNYPPDTTDGWSEQAQWFEAKCIYTTNHLELIMDGITITTVKSTGAFVFDSNVSASVSCWACQPSVKNMTFSNTTLNLDATWTASDWTSSVVENETVYYSGAEIYNIHTLNYTGTTGSYNSLSFDVRFDGIGNEDERNLTLCVNSSNDSTQYAALQILPRWSAVRLQIVKNGAGTVLDALNYTPTEWLNVKCIFDLNYLAMYINGILAIERYESHWNEFNDTSLYFTSWGEGVQVKNLAFSNVNVTGLGEWRGESYSVDSSSGTNVYTVNYVAGQVAQLTFTALSGNANSLSVDILPSLVGTEDQRNAGVAVFGRNSEAYLFFEIMPARREARIRLINGSSTLFAVSSNYAAPASGEYLNMECVFEDEYAGLFINGMLMASYFGNFGFDFDDTKVLVSSWDCQPSFKNMTFATVSKTLAEMGYCDLDFTDERSADAVTGTGANISYDLANKEIDCTLTTSEHSIEVLVNQLAGAKYSMYLPVRNTFLFRMKNATSSTMLRIQFQTTTGGSTWYSKDLTIQANSDYATYLCNVSNLGADGYLRKLKLTFLEASSGTVSIDAISFEREEQIYEYAAESMSMTATSTTVTFTGKLLSKYGGQKVTLYTTTVENVLNDLNWAENKTLKTAMADGNGNFTITFPFKQDGSNMNHLSTVFLAGVNGVKLSKSFQIENLDDFVTNPYAFTLANRTVRVTDAQFGAKGDAFTNDNAAIQAAIDYVSSQGGGTVILPGDNSEFGRRYVATNLRMKSNVELRIEKGAVILQSPRISDYDYELVMGHDYETDVMWPHACNVNKPLILCKSVQNIKITGGGEVRMMDWGSEHQSPWEIIDPNYGKGCATTIHIAPIYNVNVTNAEYSNIRIMRTNNWNLSFVFCKNICVKNIFFGQANCKNSDGVGMTNCENLFICRNRTFTSDDSFTINSIPSDPRWFSEWATPESNSTPLATNNLELCYNNMRGGLGLVFIPWGTGYSDLSKVEIKNVVGYNNVFAGFGQSIGSWVDNPFYGWSSNGNYNLTDGEKDDASPIKDVYLYDNIYYNNNELVGTAGFPVGSAKVTNFNSTSKVENSTKFVNASFERDLRYDNEVNWVSGLSYWTEVVGTSGTLGYEQRGTKSATSKYDGNTHTVKDYAAYIKGEGKLFQGLYLTAGTYKLTMSIKAVSGTAKMFVGTPVMKQHVTDATQVNVATSRVLSNSNSFTTCTFVFTINAPGIYALGVEHSGATSSVVYLDDASIVSAASGDSLASAKEQLQAQIDIAKAISQGMYTNTSFNALQSAITNGESVVKATSSTESQLDVARTNIANALNGLTQCTHVWDNDCDTTCNSCPHTRTITHNYNQKTQAYKATDATCTSAATYYYTCSCGEKGNETYSYGSVDTTKHNVGAWIEEVPSTCFANGTKGHYTCADCHKNLDENKEEILDLTIVSTGHEESTWIEEIPAQVGVAGTKGHYHCSKCNKDYDINYEEIIDLVIPALQDSSSSQEASSDITSSTTSKKESARGGCGSNLSTNLVMLLPLALMALIVIAKKTKKQ